MRRIILGTALLLAAPAWSAPILTVAPTSIGLSPTQTVITFSVDPNGTPIFSLELNLSALASGLEIVDVLAIDPQISASGPGISGSDWIGSFISGFSSDRTLSFVVGEVTVEGFVGGTPLVVTGRFFDDLLNEIPVGPVDVATVVATPEPGTLGLLALGLAVLARRPSRRC